MWIKVIFYLLKIYFGIYMIFKGQFVWFVFKISSLIFYKCMFIIIYIVFGNLEIDRKILEIRLNFQLYGLIVGEVSFIFLT